ncbi:MAG TPA: ricin-type beta-trefoil lectin domain protein [Trebonia sp.]|nr:ricin-type beta-trefoil lectin domain protein [Trebonia sp.]
MAALLAAGAAALAFAGGGTQAARAENAPPSPGSDWSTVFDDNFAGPAQTAPSLYNWTYDTGPGYYFGGGQVETMTSERRNVSLDGQGHLDITASDAGGSWTSGRIQTASPEVGAPPGGELEVTASIKQPDPADGAGYWPAFWLLGPGQWPENGEIDILESVDALSQNGSAVHCGADNGGPCDEPSGIGSGLRACAGCQAGYHTYTLFLDRTDPADESMAFYLDGRQYFTVHEAQIGAATWEQAFDHNMSVILDLAVGGSYPDALCDCSSPTSATTSGGTMSVAYVAAYESDGAALGPVGPLAGYHGMCVSTRHGGTANLAPVQVVPCDGNGDQRWTYNLLDGTLQLMGMCLDVRSGRTANRTPADLFYCDGTPAQTWLPQGYGELYNPQSGKCLDLTGWSTAPGTPLEIYQCTSRANQSWTMP